MAVSISFSIILIYHQETLQTKVGFLHDCFRYRYTENRHRVLWVVPNATAIQVGMRATSQAEEILDIPIVVSIFFSTIPV